MTRFGQVKKKVFGSEDIICVLRENCYSQKEMYKKNGCTLHFLCIEFYQQSLSESTLSSFVLSYYSFRRQFCPFMYISSLHFNFSNCNF